MTDSFARNDARSREHEVVRNSLRSTAQVLRGATAILESLLTDLEECSLLLDAIAAELPNAIDTDKEV